MFCGQLARISSSVYPVIRKNDMEVKGAVVD
jgi:hypothetical protein